MKNQGTEEFRQSFRALMKQAHRFKKGTHNIRVKQVLAVGVYGFSMPEVAIIEDSNGRILVIPEDKNGHSKLNPLVSRWDIKRGMKLRLVLGRNNSIRVFKI